MIMSLGAQRVWPPATTLCRSCLRDRIRSIATTQRRQIHKSTIAKQRNAEKEWQEQANEIKTGEARALFDILEERGYIKDLAGTREHVRETMRRKRVGAYVGIDPTAPSLHLGHLLPLMALFWMYMHGYQAISLIGGATAAIGDPTDRLHSREAMTSVVRTSNIAKIQFQLKKLWANVEERARTYGYKKDWAWRKGIVNNSHWWHGQPLMEVLQRLGAHTRIGPMLSRDTVKNKMAKGDGMSFAEFTYPLMQGWDWWQLFKQRGITMQIGGSDQYGNIVTGADALKACIASEPNPDHSKWAQGEFDQPIGFTVPLLTDSSGAKFGKSAGNAVWLDPFETSPYDVYGYFMRRPDADVEQLLRLFTFLPLERIQEAMAEQTKDPSKRVPHHLLAQEVLTLVHGPDVAKEAQVQHGAMYNKTAPGVVIEPSEEGTAATSAPSHVRAGGDDYSAVVGHPTTPNNAPRIDMQLPMSLIQAKSIARILYAAGLADSTSDGQRIVLNRGAYIGGRPGQPAARNEGMLMGQLQFTPVVQWFPELTEKFLIDGKMLILRKGKHNLRIIEVVSDEEWEKSGRTYRGQPGSGKIRTLLRRIENAKKRIAQETEWNEAAAPKAIQTETDASDGSEVEEKADPMRALQDQAAEKPAEKKWEQ